MTATSLLRAAIVDHLTRKATIPNFGVLLVTLNTADPGLSGAGDYEITAGGYEAQSLDGIMSEADPVTGISVNASSINFGVPTEGWPPAAYLGLKTVSGGILVTGAPSTPKIVVAGQPFLVPPGQLRLRVT